MIFKFFNDLFLGSLIDVIPVESSFAAGEMMYERVKVFLKPNPYCISIFYIISSEENMNLSFYYLNLGVRASSSAPNFLSR